MKTIKCNTAEFDVKYPEKWPPNVNHIKLNIHEHTNIPSVLPDGLVKFDIKSSNCKHIPNDWPASLTEIRVQFESDYTTATTSLFIRKSDLEKYKALGLNINPQQLAMIMLNITRSSEDDYGSDDDDDDMCSWCGRS